MHRLFITLVLSTSLAVSGLTAQPAAAGDDDAAKWIAGLAALAAIGIAIKETNDRRDRRKRMQSHVHERQHKHTHNQTHKPHNPRNHKILPGNCRRHVQLHGQNIRGLGRHCLKKNNVNVQALPRECAYRVHDNQGRKRVLFGGRCLRQYGYRVAGTH